MGTRSDFYIRKIEQNKPVMEWIGSFAFDGYPSGFDSAPEFFTAKSEKEFRAWFSEIASKRDDATIPENGWPWPWDDSTTTDYAYVFDCGDSSIMAFCFGHKFELLPALQNDGDIECDSEAVIGYFPDMSDLKNVTYGPRSGLIVLSIG